MLGKRKIRRYAFDLLFGLQFQKDVSAEDFYQTMIENETIEDDEEGNVKTLFLDVVSHNEEINRMIEQYSKDWKVNRISKASLSIMKISICEMKFRALPPAISINEAVEIAKEFAEEGAPSFINGILNKYAKENILN